MQDFSRRKNFYDRCQQIVDDLHERVAKGEFIDEKTSKKLYGKADYNAFFHQLRKEDADYDHTTMTPAMEWMHHSQYFLWLKEQEQKRKWQLRINIIMAFIAFAAAVAAGFSAYYAANPSNSKPCECKTCEYHSHEDKEADHEHSHHINIAPTSYVFYTFDQRHYAKV